MGLLQRLADGRKKIGLIEDFQRTLEFSSIVRCALKHPEYFKLDYTKHRDLQELLSNVRSHLGEEGKLLDSYVSEFHQKYEDYSICVNLHRIAASAGVIVVTSLALPTPAAAKYLPHTLLAIYAPIAATISTLVGKKLYEIRGIVREKEEQLYRLCKKIEDYIGMFRSRYPKAYSYIINCYDKICEMLGLSKERFYMDISKDRKFLAVAAAVLDYRSENA